jgi:Class II Aldolase and Adducin N-terminal domain
MLHSWGAKAPVRSAASALLQLNRLVNSASQAMLGCNDKSVQAGTELMNYSTDFPSIKERVSPQEWQTRVELAACYRLIDKYEMTDLIYNHITARVPGEEDVVLLNLYGLLYKEITASSLVKIHVDGEIIWKPDTDYDINKSGYVRPAAALPDRNPFCRTRRLSRLRGAGRRTRRA